MTLVRLLLLLCFLRLLHRFCRCFAESDKLVHDNHQKCMLVISSVFIHRHSDESEIGSSMQELAAYEINSAVNQQENRK